MSLSLMDWDAQLAYEVFTCEILRRSGVLQSVATSINGTRRSTSDTSGVLSHSLSGAAHNHEGGEAGATRYARAEGEEERRQGRITYKAFSTSLAKRTRGDVSTGFTPMGDITQ